MEMNTMGGGSRNGLQLQAESGTLLPIFQRADAVPCECRTMPPIAGQNRKS